MTPQVSLPDVSIVTPSYNQGTFLEQNLLNIAGQGILGLEHIVIDGGSTDNSREILNRHQENLAYWVFEPDNGQYDAINKGFRSSTGEIMAWLNADDIYFPGTLRLVQNIFAQFPQVEWLTTLYPFACDEHSLSIKMGCAYGFDAKGFFHGNNLVGAGWPGVCYIQQESTFWRRSLWERTGGYVDASYNFAGDFDLWARFFRHAKLYGVDVPLGIYRRQPEQKTSVALGSYVEEAKKSLTKHGGTIPSVPTQTVRLWARKVPWLRKCLVMANVLEAAQVITYDWGTQVWDLKES